MENTNLEEIAMTIIANSGEARGLAFAALSAARDESDFAKANDLIKQANDYSLVAHKAQTDLLVATAKGEDIKVDILTVHSQDHLMTAMLAIELITEMIKMLEK